ncbi:MAG: TatD family hydrolase [Clostridia bacterium]|nr:TatD family hydrolase [Clostridia bacterium]
MIDTHAHLNDEDLIGRAEEILSSPWLETVIVPGYDYKSSKLAYDLAKKYDKVYATLGCHPHDAESFSHVELEFYKSHAKDKKVVAIGEIGLDYYRDLSPREVQKKVFEEQIVLADEVGLPIVLHVRDAYQDTLDILKKHKNRLNNGVLLHCYSGSAELVREFQRLDAYFAFGGAVTYKNAKKEDVLRAVSLDRLLLETDCPYMTPVPVRWKVEMNEPKFIEYTLNHVANVLGFTAQELEKITTDNAKRFFGL